METGVSEAMAANPGPVGLPMRPIRPLRQPTHQAVDLLLNLNSRERIYIYVCVCVYMYICTHIYVCIYIHAHTLVHIVKHMHKLPCVKNIA